MVKISAAALLNRLRRNQRVLYGSLFFISGLLLLPYFIREIVPCLKHIPGQAFESYTCNLNSVMDYYLYAGLVFFSGSVLYSHTVLKLNLRKLILLACALALLLIWSFLRFIPQAETEIAGASIYIDSQE